MKKLNNKGFTLVELLAVIIILAIVVGISIPAITNIINDSKNNALGVAVDAAEKYLVDQYALMNVDYGSADDAFKTKFTSANVGKDLSLTSTDAALIKKMGLTTTDITTMTVKVNADGTACVKVTKIPTGSQYYTTAYWNTSGAPLTGTSAPSNASKGC